ncbi:MAG: hypothetical protein V5A64_02770 [Candidatus Thermoplasmatota archaeon]
MTSNISKYIFRAYDIRGKYGEDITPEIFYKIGLSAGCFLKRNIDGNCMAVGNDIRKSSIPLVYAFISGVAASGVNVTYTGTTSFGQTLLKGWKMKKDLIAFVTASHLPAEWNGIKFYYGDGVGLPEEKLKQIRDITLNDEFKEENWQKTGEVQVVNPKDDYVDFFKQNFDFKKEVKVAVDCGGGSMSLSAPEVFKKVGLKTIPVFCEADPSLSARPADPKPKNLSKLVEMVKKESCDFGVAFDGDGDRSVIVDDEGHILSSDETGIIIGKHGVENKRKNIIANVECSKALTEQLEPLGYHVKRIQVGHTFLTLHAKKEKAVLGVESSGHIILPNYFLFDDALVVPLKMAETIQKTKKSLSELLSEVPTYPTKKLEVECSDQKKFEVIDKLIEELKEEYDDLNTMDGVRVNLENGWVLIRASNTSPVIRVTSEADDEKQADEIANKFKNKTEEIVEQFKK